MRPIFSPRPDFGGVPAGPYGAAGPPGAPYGVPDGYGPPLDGG
ncbi:hypothetical protein [Plantactinospora sp. BB1]|nr:hypothetical protein [Plantactinospora sp. BB1]